MLIVCTIFILHSEQYKWNRYEILYFYSLNRIFPKIGLISENTKQLHFHYTNHFTSQMPFHSLSSIVHFLLRSVLHSILFINPRINTLTISPLFSSISHSCMKECFSGLNMIIKIESEISNIRSSTFCFIIWNMIFIQSYLLDYNNNHLQKTK